MGYATVLFEYEMVYGVEGRKEKNEKIVAKQIVYRPFSYELGDQVKHR